MEKVLFFRKIWQIENEIFQKPRKLFSKISEIGTCACHAGPASPKRCVYSFSFPRPPRPGPGPCLPVILENKENMEKNVFP